MRHPSLAGLALFAAGLLFGQDARAQAAAEARERCATRLSLNLTGQSASGALLSSANPQSSVPALLATPAFEERFASFINSRFNPERGINQVQDATYYMTLHVLRNDRPWRDMFLGPFKVERTDPASAGSPAVIVNDASALGYLSSSDWRIRYRGNELQGYRLVHAYRLINNILGIELQAAVNTDGVNAEGRKGAACSGCHYHPVFGLDLIAKLLPLRNGRPTNEGPQTLLGGRTLSNERELVTAMVNSVDFRFNACRLAMQFAYARKEFKCEGPIFDACMTTFQSTGKIRDAIAAITQHPTYCQ